KKLNSEYYPDQSGVVLSAYGFNWPMSETVNEDTGVEDGPDDPLLQSKQKQRLDDHTSQVTKLADKYAHLLGLDKFRLAIDKAATYHDVGKADPRFQAMLIRSTLSAAQAQPCLWAKSDSIPLSAKGRREIRERASLPSGFRHEMLSVQLASLPSMADKLGG